MLTAGNGGRRRRVSTAGGGGGSGALPRALETLQMGKIWGKRSAEGVSNPRFSAREDGADLGLLNFAYDHVGAREYGAELAT
jgi:hypothetical protein